MKRILIADASKASLVMTSEVFKDHFPGVQVVVARTSADAIEAAKSGGELDAFIIDYDLPDRDGAYTAARLKKNFSQPILITAFDRADVQESIDRELSAFDDCLSWIKKPVKPEMVVSLAQRFIEGKHRCQRRVDCSLPAFMEVELTPVISSVGTQLTTMEVARAKAVSKKSSSKSSVQSERELTRSKPTAGKTATGKVASGKPTTGKTVAGKVDSGKPTTGKTVTGKVASGKPTTGKAVTGKVASGKPTTGKAAPTTPAKTSESKRIVKKEEQSFALKPMRKVIPVLIDDVSLGGLKIRVCNNDLTVLVPVKGKNVRMSCSFNEEQVLKLFVPPAHMIAAGAEALEKWKKAQAKLLSVEDFSGKKAATVSGSAVGSPVSTLSPGPQLARNALAKQVPEPPVSQGHFLHANVRWTGSSETFTFCGLRSEAVNISKKLFEALIEIQMAMRSQLSPTVSPNSARLSKLNA